MMSMIEQNQHDVDERRGVHFHHDIHFAVAIADVGSTDDIAIGA